MEAIQTFIMLMYGSVVAIIFGAMMYSQYSILGTIRNMLIQIFMFIIVYLAPISNFIHAVLVLMFFDLLTGSYASYKRGEKFKASKLRKTVEKFIFYSVAIVVAFVLQRIMNDGTALAQIAATFIGSIELKSIYENISSILGVDFVSYIWKILKNKMENNINNSQNNDKGA